MSTEKQTFHVSTGLKDLIGRDLITDDFVAVFELVKNSFDAHATQVKITFEDDRIIIADNGKGINKENILEKWLWVAYSAKKDGTEDADYRDVVEKRKRPFAGAKGVGRFSCDRLGSMLNLYSKTANSKVQKLNVNWEDFEVNSKEEFTKVKVELSELYDFPGSPVKPPGSKGTVLEITSLRSQWGREKLQALKRELSKLIDPFSSKRSKFKILIVAKQEEEQDKEDAEYNKSRSPSQDARTIVNGPVENPILESLGDRTTRITVELTDDGDLIETTLVDRGELIYRIREPNTYSALTPANPRAEIYYLNRSAKQVFAIRMGIPVVQFGSIFLFRNGFRIFPVGTENDDFFGIARRQQQGSRRFIGKRDLIGRVDIEGAEGFDEATSRNDGLILTPQAERLIEFVREKCIKRLERYVVDISWKDKADKDALDTSRIRTDDNSAKVAQLVSRLAASAEIELVEFNKDIIRIVDDKSEAFELSLKAMEIIAEREGSPGLQEKIAEARARIEALRQAEAEAREAEARAEQRAQAAEKQAATLTKQYESEKERNEFLVAAGSLDRDTILNLHHQILLHSSSVSMLIKQTIKKIRKGVIPDEKALLELLEKVSFSNSQITTAARFATKGGYKHQSAEIKADLPTYISDYIENIASLWVPQGLKVTENHNNHKFTRSFKPIQIGMLIDNLVSNSGKPDAGASEIIFELDVEKGQSGMLCITVADNGNGWPDEIRPLSRVFEKGVTTTTGSGLGLYHVKHIVEELGGAIEVTDEAFSDKFKGAHLKIRIPK